MKRTLLLTLAFPALLSAAAGDDLGLLPEPKRVVRTAAVGFRPTTATPLVLQLLDDVAAAVRPAARALGFSVSGTDCAKTFDPMKTSIEGGCPGIGRGRATIEDMTTEGALSPPWPARTV